MDSPNQTSVQLDAYLKRIHYTGARDVSLHTLTSLHRAHLLAIPYENLDIHLGRTLSLNEASIFEKLVTARRGGWCFEMNGLFAWALRALGFSVTRLASAVNRQTQGAQADRNHLILLVNLDHPYLADVGFGNGFLEPLPLAEGTYQQGFLTYRLEQTPDHWVFTNHVYGGAGFDFTLEPRTLPDFAEQCHRLQTSPQSSFVQTTVCHRFTSQGYQTLKGAVLRAVSPIGSTERVISTESDYQAVLTQQFDLALPDSEVAALWAQVWKRHQEWVNAG